MIFNFFTTFVSVIYNIALNDGINNIFISNKKIVKKTNDIRTKVIILQNITFCINFLKIN